ncbi:LOW QUALITY PROTEIN: hypothetical protein QYF61_012947, partial [Mycteria americana]
MPRAPELEAALQGRSHQSRAERQNRLPRPAAHAAFDAAQDTVGLLGCERTLSAHVQLFVHQYPEVLFCRAALDHIIRQPVLIPGLAPTQDPALGLVEPHEVHTAPLLQLVQVSVDDIPSFWRVNCTTQLGVICRLAEGALDLAVNVIDENIEQHWSQYGPLRDTTSVDCYPLDATIQPIPYPLNSPPIKSISLQFREKDVVQDHQPFLLFFASLAKFSSSCTLAFLTPSLHKRAVSLYSSQVTCPCFHCLCSSLLLSSLTSIHAGLFPSLPDFLHLGTESSCTFWKASLKICQLCFAPLSLRTISQGVILTNSLKSCSTSLLSDGSLQTRRNREKQRKRGLKREDMLSTVHLFTMLVGERFGKSINLHQEETLKLTVGAAAVATSQSWLLGGIIQRKGEVERLGRHLTEPPSSPPSPPTEGLCSKDLRTV